MVCDWILNFMQKSIWGVFKKRPNFCYKTLLLILLHFKHCPLQSSPLYWRYTIPSIFSIVGMLLGTHFLWWRAVLLSHSPESPPWFENDILPKWCQVWETGKSPLGLSPENRVDVAQRMSRVLPDNCGWGATCGPVNCRGATSKSGFPTIQASSCTQHPSNALKLPGTTVCLPFDHMVQIHDGQCLSNQKTQPTSAWSLTDSSMLFFGRGDPFPIHCDDCVLISTSCP